MFIVNFNKKYIKLSTHLTALLTRFSELGVIIVAAKEQPILLDVPTGQLQVANGTSKTVGMPILTERPNVHTIVQVVEATRAL